MSMTTPSADVPTGRPAAIDTPRPGDPRLARLSLNQQTIPSWGVAEVVDACVRAGVPAVGLWREPVQEAGLAATAALVRQAGLRVSSLCRAGFLTAEDPEESAAAVRETRLAIDEAAALGAACLPVVPGGLPPGSTDLEAARRRLATCLDELVPSALDRGVRLALEPLHPMLCADRGVVCTLGDALDIVQDHPADVVGVVVDSYHVWWDPDLARSLRRAGTRIASYQVNDWILPLAEDMRLSRGMMGDGFIDLPAMGRMVEAAGFDGDVEVEIFNADIWAADPHAVLETILRRHATHTAPPEVHPA